MKQGLLPLSQEACLLGDVSYHSYQGLVVDAGERETLARDLGVHNKNMLLRNHGAVCCGETLEEAFFYAYHLVLACETQLKMAPLGLDNLVTIDDATRRKVYELGQAGGGGVNSVTEGGPDGQGEKKKRSWGVGELEFEALMRNLDNAVSPNFRPCTISRIRNLGEKRNPGIKGTLFRLWPNFFLTNPSLILVSGELAFSLPSLLSSREWSLIFVSLPGLPHRLHLQAAPRQGGAGQAQVGRRAPAVRVVTRLLARGGEPLQGRVRQRVSFRNLVPDRFPGFGFLFFSSPIFRPVSHLDFLTA